MSTTVNIYASASAIINKSNPTSNQHGISSKSYSTADLTDITLLLVFPGVADTYKFRPFTTAYHVYGKSAGGSGHKWRANLSEYSAFDPDTVTYNSAPKPVFPYKNNKTSADHSGAGWESVSDFPTNISTDPMYVSCQYWGLDTVTMYGSASSSYKPYMEITFADTDAYLQFDTMIPADGSVVVSGMQSRFGWLTKQSAATAAEIEQASAVFRWKKPTDANWNEIQINDDSQDVYIPAGTFPGGKILWQVEMTDVTGHTVTSATRTAYTTATLSSLEAVIVGTEFGDLNVPYNPAQSYVIRNNSGRMLAAKFQQIPSGILYHKLIQARLRASFSNGLSSSQGYNLYGLANSINIQSAKYSDLSMVSGRYGYGSIASGASGEATLPSYYLATNAPTGATTELKNALGSRGILTTDCISLIAYADKTYNITGDLFLEVAYDDSVTITSQVVQQNCPTAGWVNPGDAQTFAWDLVSFGDWPSVGSFTQASASFFWKEANDANWTEIQISGSTQEVTIPANTFPGGTISWYVEATDTNGTTTNTPTYTISTEDTIPTATPYDPVGIPVTGNNPIRFRWTVSNDSGSLPTQSDLEVSEDGGSTWTALATISGSATTYTAPANSFTASTVYWRVKAYNRDGVAGSWSAAASFLNIAAPAAPTVTVQEVPFATFNWQATGQQAYRITVDGKTYGPFFGTDKTFTLEDYLEDGEHTAAVEVQGSYGLWSNPGTANFTISNSPGDAVALSGVFGIDAELSWTTESTAEDFLIYRNGVRIGHTAGLSFTDRFALGEVQYTVINRLTDGNYTRSNTVSGELSAGYSQIAALRGGAWVELMLTERSQTEQIYNYTRKNSLLHVTGSAWPILELSPFENLTASYDAAFQTAEDAKAFEALRGQPVIIKSRAGVIVVGALTTIRKTVGDFYLTYEFTVQRVHWEDFVDDP